MSQMPGRFQALFLELFEGLPRQGPGNRASTARALGLCVDLPPAPAIIDLGCGVGAQSLHLAELVPSASIVAVDLHPPSIERLRAERARRGLGARVSAEVGDMACPPQSCGPFDLVWSEGALYNIGLRNALCSCHALLRPGGYLAFTDAVWRRADPPASVRAAFEGDYPTMGTVSDDLAAIGDCGFRVVGHFVLPDEAWWDDFYSPMEIRIGVLRAKYADDREALSILDQLADEPAMHRRHADFYAYAFFVARRGGT